MKERRANPSPAEKIEQGNAQIAKYNRRLLLLAAVTGLVLIVLMFFTLVKVISLAEDAKNSSREAAEQTRVIAELVEAQSRNDANRQRLIDEAVEKIAAEQYRALVAHDRRMESLIRRNLHLTAQEVHSPSNQEQRALPAIPKPFVGPRLAPQPAPAPAPAPPPCERAGKSGKCKK